MGVREKRIGGDGEGREEGTLSCHNKHFGRNQRDLYTLEGEMFMSLGSFKIVRRRCHYHVSFIIVSVSFKISQSLPRLQWPFEHFW